MPVAWSTNRKRPSLPDKSQKVVQMPSKHRIEFQEVSTPITEAVTKFGGQPTWVGEPQWPLSRETGNPMRFVCQIKLTKELFPEATAHMAYLFMTDEENGEFVDGTYEPDGGENAVILQPGATVHSTTTLTEGPTLYRMVEMSGKDRLQPEPCEFAVLLTVDDDFPFVSEAERRKMPDNGVEATYGNLNECKIDGTPVFMQGDEFPFDGPCWLLLQLDSCSVPFYVNFGDAGVGYAFINQAGDQARFLWQCG
jgi:uncharacterized protein YwqG